MYGRKALLLVRSKEVTPQLQHPEFVVVWDAGREFVGSTPTAPFAKLALFVGSLDVPNGVKVTRTVCVLKIARVQRWACTGGPLSMHTGEQEKHCQLCIDQFYKQQIVCMQAFGFDNPIVQTALRRAQRTAQQGTASHSALPRPLAAAPGTLACI